MRIRELINDLEHYAKEYGDETPVHLASDIGWNGTGVYNIEYTEGLVDSIHFSQSLYPKCRHEIEHRYAEEGEGRIKRAIFLSKSGYGVCLPTTDFLYHDHPAFEHVDDCEICQAVKGD